MKNTEMWLNIICLSILCLSLYAAAATDAPSGTTADPGDECTKLSKSCGECLSVTKCLWCGTDSTCKAYPVNHLLPRGSDCSLSDARWGVCWVNFEALIIAMSVIGGIILITLCCCVYCCCCRTNKSKLKKKLAKDEDKWEREREDRRSKAEERKADRKVKADEIRKKYGSDVNPNDDPDVMMSLIKDDNPYSKFENA